MRSGLWSTGLRAGLPKHQANTCPSAISSTVNRPLSVMADICKEHTMPRPLLPKPPTISCQASLQLSNLDPRLREQHETSAPQAKRAQVRVACIACQKKKTKCDSLRPSCARCAKRNVVCTYDVEPEVSRLTSMLRRNEVLQTERDLLYRLIVYMSTCSEVELQEVFGRLRTCHDPTEIAESLSD